MRFVSRIVCLRMRCLEIQIQLMLSRGTYLIFLGSQLDKKQFFLNK